MFQVVFYHGEAEKGTSEEAENFVDKLLPELTAFCNYVRDYVVNHMGKVPPREDDDDDEEPDEVGHLFLSYLRVLITMYFTNRAPSIVDGVTGPG